MALVTRDPTTKVLLKGLLDASGGSLRGAMARFALTCLFMGVLSGSWVGLIVGSALFPSILYIALTLQWEEERSGREAKRRREVAEFHVRVDAWPQWKRALWFLFVLLGMAWLTIELVRDWI